MAGSYLDRLGTPWFFALKKLPLISEASTHKERGTLVKYSRGRLLCFADMLFLQKGNKDLQKWHWGHSSNMQKVYGFTTEFLQNARASHHFRF